MTMAQPAQDLHRYRVHARHVDQHHARVLEEASFEAAAVAYVEDLHDVPADDAISVIVRDLDGGHEHCFTIDLETGDAEPCS